MFKYLAFQNRLKFVRQQKKDLQTRLIPCNTCNVSFEYI